MEKEYGSIDAFREAAKTAPNEPIEAASVRASFDTDVKASEEEGSRTLLFTISTANVDRQGDTIAVDGWKLENYRKNPVVLWAHDPYSLPIARAVSVRTEDKKLKADALFTPLGMAKFNDTIFEMFKQGFLSATSVGFSPHKYAFSDDPQRRYGIDFLEQELLEFSAVCIPANAEALVEGKAAGLDIAPVLDWCETQLKREKGRVLKLAESVLGKDNTSAIPELLPWAERIINGLGKLIMPEGHISMPRSDKERMDKAAHKDRLRRKRERELDIIKLGRVPG